MIARLERMTVLSEQDHFDARPIAHKLPEELFLCSRITAAARPSEHVDRNNQFGSNATPSQQRPALRGTDFENHTRTLLRDEFNQPAVFRFYLPGGKIAIPAATAVGLGQVPEFLRRNVFGKKSL